MTRYPWSSTLRSMLPLKICESITRTGPGYTLTVRTNLGSGGPACFSHEYAEDWPDVLRILTRAHRALDVLSRLSPSSENVEGTSAAATRDSAAGAASSASSAYTDGVEVVRVSTPRGPSEVKGLRYVAAAPGSRFVPLTDDERVALIRMLLVKGESFEYTRID